MSSTRSTSARRAATLTEVAVVILVCLLLICAVYEYGRFLMVRELVDNAAREGARQAASGTNVYTTAGIQNTVLQYLANQQVRNASGQPLQAADVEVYRADPASGQPASPDSTWTNAAFGQPIAVRVNASYRPMLP